MIPAATVSILSIACMAVTGCVSLFFPILLFLFWRKKKGLLLLPVLVGVITFVLFARTLESIAINLLFANEAVRTFLTSQPLIYALYGGLMAGVFEETGRLCSFYFILNRRSNSLGGALSYGIGHGGIEAVILVTLTMVNNIVISVTINSVGMDAYLAMLSTAQAEAIQPALEQLISVAPVSFLAGGLERVLAICFHLAASVLVWMSASGRGPWGLYFLAILFHTLTNLPAGFYQQGLLSMWPLEAVTAALVLAICITTYVIYNKCSQTYTSLLSYNPPDYGKQ